MTGTDAEFVLRSLAIEALAVCSEAGISMATITAIPHGADDDADWWHVVYEPEEGMRMTVSSTYEGGVDEEG